MGWVVPVGVLETVEELETASGMAASGMAASVEMAMERAMVPVVREMCSPPPLV
jgi:hypothetical protein